MARTKSGGFSKILEFIGLVDDEETNDIYDDEYESEDYGRSQSYTPRRDTRARDRERPQMTRRRSSYEPSRPTARPQTRAPQSGRVSDSRTSQTKRSASAPSGRTSSRFDYNPRSSRFDEPASAPQNEAPVRESRSSARQRTVMYSIRALEDCCDVIDNLILNNTVLLNMEELDNTVMQRSVDTLSGAVFALHATIRKVSERTYLIAPMNVEVDEAYSDRRM